MALNSIRLALLATFTVSLAACMPASTTPMDGGGTDTTTGPTYTHDVQPILAAKCGPCHTTQNMGQHNIAAHYDEVMHPVVSVDAQGCWKDAEQTMPKTLGECAWISIMNGWMPFASGCGAPSGPPDPSLCLTAEQKATVMMWVANGMPE